MRPPSAPTSNHKPLAKLFKGLLLFAPLLFVCLQPQQQHSCDQQQPRQQRFVAFAQAQQRFVDSSAATKPSLILILPQSFKVPTNPSLWAPNATTTAYASDLPRLQQYVAVVNNAQDDREDERIRQQYKRLSLQVRDARTTFTGQLFFEHQFDYFAPGAPKFLLIPVNLDQVSVPVASASGLPSSPSSQQQATYSTRAASDGVPAQESPALVYQAQQLIVSIRPVLETSVSGFATRESVAELVSSAPVLVEPVPSSDGRRSFSVVQTDKPVYKPTERVRIRAMVVNENLRPVVGDELKLQIRNPHKIIVESRSYPRAPNEPLASQQQQQQQPQLANSSLYIDHVFEFPPEPMPGKWSVHLLHGDSVANDTTTFEVHEYVLPPFELTLESPKYILPNTQQISGAALARYHFGKPVLGKVQFKFGIMSPHETKYIARSSIKNIDPGSGRVEYNISLDKFAQYKWFPDVAESRLLVEATATDMTTGQRETASDSSCVFMNMPYAISFEESIEDFKPGLSQQLVVRLVERLSQRPGPAGQRILAEFRDQNRTLLSGPPGAEAPGRGGLFDSEATTDGSGRAVFKVGPVGDDVRHISVTMKLIDDSRQPATGRAEAFASGGFTGVELAIGNHSLVRHDSLNGWIALMNKSVTEVSVGDRFVSDFLMKDFTLLPQRVFFMVMARGQILTMDTIDRDGLVSFEVTELMMPSIRLVLFALTPDSIGLVSDSMRIGVNQNLDCGLKLAYRARDDGASQPWQELSQQQQQQQQQQRQQQRAVRPNARGFLDVTARQGDLVSLIGVDNAIFSLNNRTRLDSRRIVERIKLLDTGCGFGGGKNNLDVFHNAGLMVFRRPASDTLGHIGSACLANPMRYVEEAAMGYPKPMLARIGQDPEVGAHIRPYAPRYLARPRREADPEAILRRYRDPLHKACCRLGTLEDIPQRRNCSVRRRIVEKYMRHSDRCAGIYFDCCRHVFGETDLNLSGFAPALFPGDAVESSSLLGGKAGPLPGPDPQFTEAVTLDKMEADTLVRRDFRETWLFDLVPVEGADGRASLEVQLPHSITSWSVSAVALNPYRPVCIMVRPFRLHTFQEVFVQLSMPYRIVQGEQIDLVASLYNYSPRAQEVLVYTYGLEDVCSDAEPGERSEQRRLRLETHSSQAVVFSMIPLRVGQYPIKVVAVTVSSNASDIIERQLNVVPKGKTVTEETTFSLDPMNQQRRSKRAIQTGNLVDEIDSTRGLQHSTIQLRPTRDSDHIVPATQECIISAIGDKLGHVVQTSLLDVENLIRLPQGCGEQVMIYLGPTLYTAKYLDSVDKLTGDLRWRAIRYIQSGYKRILNYRHDATGAFSAFPNRDPSTWLTAFVAKMLCQTERTAFIAQEVHVDRTVVNSALQFLIAQQDSKLGTWLEKNPVYHREMLGGVLKESALTAFVALTLNECAHHSMDIVDEVEMPGRHSNQQVSSDSLALTVSGGGGGGDDNNGQESAARTQTNGFERLRAATRRAEEAILRDRHKALREKNPYVMALMAYALSFNRPREAAATLNDLMPLAEHLQSKNQKFWRGRYNVETNAYALQAIIELAPLVTPDPTLATSSSASPSSQATGGASLIAVNWRPGADALSLANFLSSRRTYSGAFESTQDTVVGLEALAKFVQLQSSPNGNLLLPQTAHSSQPNLLCNLTISNRTRRSIEFGKANAQILQTFKLDSFDLDPASGENLDIVTRGSGLGTMSVKLKYNVLQTDDELCRFDIGSEISEWRPPRIFRSAGPSSGDATPYNTTPGETGAPNESLVEEEIFKTFDKSMLNELNLLEPNQSPSQESPMEGEGAERRLPPPPTVAPYLRLRRDVLQQQQHLDNTSGGRVALNQQVSTASITESWTSKIVSNLRSKLPEWIAPKVGAGSGQMLPETARPPPPQPQSAATTITQPPPPPPRPPRRNSTSRRSAQAAPWVTAGPKPTSPIPVNVSLNSLSGQFESTSYNKTTNSTTIVSLNENPAHRLVLLLRVCAHHMSATRDSEMAVIEVGVLSGFKPNEADLREVVEEDGSPALKYELSTDRSLVVLYMEYLPSATPYCFQFRLIRDSPVYNLQSGYIRVYEYYSPSRSCSNFYTPSRVANLLDVRCVGQACQCAARSLCPATRKLLHLGERHQANVTSARAKLVEQLICSDKYDLVSLVSLKSVQNLESARLFKLAVKIKSDLRGNLTRVVVEQRRQRALLGDSVRRPHYESTNLALGTNETTHLADTDLESSLEYLSLSLDASCVRDDPLLLHLAHPNQLKQGGKTMILFARSDKLERRFFRTVAKAATGPRPKPNRFSGDASHKWQQADDRSPPPPPPPSLAPHRDAQDQQYSLHLPLDKETILHDMTYQAKVAPRDSINNLLLWADLSSRRDRWDCGARTATSQV